VNSSEGVRLVDACLLHFPHFRLSRQIPRLPLLPVKNQDWLLADHAFKRIGDNWDIQE